MQEPCICTGTYLYMRPYCLAIDSVLIVVRIFPMTGNISVVNYVLTAIQIRL